MSSVAVLRSNVRAHWLLMLPWLGLVLTAIVALAIGVRSGPTWLIVVALLTAVAGAWGVARETRELIKPRLAIEKDCVRVNIGNESTCIPIEVVECFFLGQGPSGIPSKSGDELEASNVIVRLAEAAQDWHHRDANMLLGHWCEGYITLRGTWCEPISLELVNRLNHELAETKRARKAKQE